MVAAQGLPDGLRVSGLRGTDLGATPLLTDSLVLEWRPDIASPAPRPDRALGRRSAAERDERWRRL